MDIMMRTANEEMTQQALHAYLLTIEHPRSGEILSWEAPLPEDLREALRQANLPEPTNK